MNYDPRKLIEALEIATGISDADSIKKKLKQHDEDDLVSALEGNDYNLSGHRNFLKKYLEELKNHRDNARLIKNVKKNYSEIEDLYTELETELDKVEEGTAELEKIANALDDKDLLKKLERRDEAKAKRLNEKLKHLISMKEKMEKMESRLESETEHFNDLEHALERRIKLVEKMRDGDDSGATGGTNNPKILSVSDVDGLEGGLNQTLALLDKSNNYSDFNFNSNEYKLVLNGNAFNHSTDDRNSEEIFNTIISQGQNGNVIYTVGGYDMFILFNEFWRCAKNIDGNKLPKGSNSFYMEIDKTQRLAFLEQLRKTNGFIKTVWNGDYLYNYANASPEPDHYLNDRIQIMAEAMYSWAHPAKNFDPRNHFSNYPDDVQDILQNKMSVTGGIYTDSSDNNLSEDLTFANKTNIGKLEAIVALQYKIQFEGYGFGNYSDYNTVFNPNSGGSLWMNWDDLVAADPGEYIVGRTEHSNCSTGNHFFSSGNHNPIHAKSEKLINECTIPSSDPNTLIVEKPSGEVCALREDGSGGVEEECIN